MGIVNKTLKQIIYIFHFSTKLNRNPRKKKNAKFYEIKLKFFKYFGPKI